ncbi:MAG: phosphoglucosamine mutase [Gaiellaceae bacterium]|jgi:phosphoglucosamine mutase
MARRYFGTDGVRGIVGEAITPELVEKLGKAVALWSGRGRVFVGRDTRASGVELEEALARGIASAGGNAVLAGVLPTPAVALLALDLGAVITASHNPPEYNGVKFFDANGQKLSDASEEEIEALLDAGAPGGGTVDHVEIAPDSYLQHVIDRFGSHLTGLRVGVDCANGAYTEIAPRAFERLGASVTVIGVEPDGTNINENCGATDLRALQRIVKENALDLGVAFDGDGDRMLAVDANGDVVDGDRILAVLAPHLGVDRVAVTVMSNLGLHSFLEGRGIGVMTTDVGDRYVLEALREHGALLGGEQSGHIIYLRDHVTGDGLAAALLLCDAIRGRTLADAAAEMPTFPQVKENLPLDGSLPVALLDEVQRLNTALNGSARVLVRPSGTEPVVRLLAEARTESEARELSDRIAALVRRELG